MDGSKKVALKIKEMLDLRAAGELKKRGSDDFISGLLAAYALINDLPVDMDTMTVALNEAQA